MLGHGRPAAVIANQITAIPDQPCAGCGALSMTSLRPVQRPRVAVCPSSIPELRGGVHRVDGLPGPGGEDIERAAAGWVMLNADRGAEQIRSPGAQISLVRLFRAPKPPGRSTATSSGPGPITSAPP